MLTYVSWQMPIPESVNDFPVLPGGGRVLQWLSHQGKLCAVVVLNGRAVAIPNLLITDVEDISKKHLRELLRGVRETSPEKKI